MAELTDKETERVADATIVGVPDGDPQEELTRLIAKATALSGIKDYVAAAEVYSQATELQAEINGEMNVENADLLYAYGRCLFFVAQKTSTVLGGTAAGAQLSKNPEKKISKKRKANGSHGPLPTNGQASLPAVTESSASTDVIEEIQRQPQESEKKNEPLFQFTGDENFDDSDDDEEGKEEEEEEEVDDFENSFELLDLSRVLYGRKLESLQQSEGSGFDKGKGPPDASSKQQLRELKSRIADIYDLQSEISLEGEKYDAAVADLKSCLELKEELELPESSLLAECHYKLSLALEVAAQEQARDADGTPVGDITINWDMRNEAIAHQEKAIASCELRVEKERQKMLDLKETKNKDKASAQIEDVQEMIGEMKDRLGELRKPPVNVKAATESGLNEELMAGVLGQIMGTAGKSKEEQKEELAKIIAGATDLSGMVKKKKPKQTSKNDETASNGSGSGTKRKVESSEVVNESSSKKAKVEDAVDTGK